jgi:hypothetical protein
MACTQMSGHGPACQAEAWQAYGVGNTESAWNDFGYGATNRC